MTTWLRELWIGTRGFVETFGAQQLFLLRLLAYLPQAFLRPRLILQQIFNAGAMSLVIIMISGMFVGMVMALQLHNTLARFGSTEALGAVTALAILRELGPVITALLFAGRAGTALASEIGLMRATEQLSGMEMMAVDPIKRIVVPRFVGGVIAMPLLAAIFSAMGIFGAYLVGVELMGVDEGAFWSEMQARVDLHNDVLHGLYKSAAFGLAASLIAVFEGFNAIPTAEGVSRGTTRTVVLTSIVVLVLDFIMTSWML